MSNIEWTGKTLNFLAGCTRVSEGCRNCYAEKMAKRLAAMGQKKYEGLLTDDGRWNGKLNIDEKAFDVPGKTKKPTTFFVNSMSDLFHESVPDAWLDKIFDVLEDNPHHIYQILTKRPERMQAYLSKRWKVAYLPQFIWLGVSVENQQAADERIHHLLNTPAAVRFLSCEPLLGPVDLNSVDRGSIGMNGFPDPVGAFAEWQEKPMRAKLRDGIDWVIAGGESGPGARPMHPEWARSLRDQCQAAGTAFFFKQWGEWLPWLEFCENPAVKDVDPEQSRFDTMIWNPDTDEWDYHGGGWGDDPGASSYEDPDQIVGRVGKRAAGRKIEGRTWDEMPEVAHV